MNKTGWSRVVSMEDLEDGIPISVAVDKTTILLVRRGETVYAFKEKCPHYGAPLSKGLLSGKEIICPWHHARFDMTSGKLTAPPALDGLPRFPLKVENGDVYVGQPDTSSAEPSAAAIDDARIFAILGAGAAGNAAAETLRREGFSGRILLITAENRLPYDRPTLSKDFLSGKASPKWLPLRDEKFYKDLRIEVMTGRQVVQLRPDEHKFIFADGKELEFDQALLATGGSPRNIPVPGSHLPGVFLLRTMDDAEWICGAAEKSGKAVILGAGFIGLEAAASLRERNLKVELAAPEEIPLQKVFGDRIGRWFQDMHLNHGVGFHLGVAAEKIEEKGEGLRVHLSDGTALDADLVIGGLGIDPAVGYLRDTNLVNNGAVSVDGCFQTEAKGIFAAGDIAMFPDRHTGEMQRVEHWVVAEAQGQHAARAMLGSQVPYGEIPFFWTRQYGRSIKYIGYAPSFDQVAFRGDVGEDSFFVGYFREGRLRAAASLGGGNEFIALGELLKAGAPPSFEDFENRNSSFIKTLKNLAL
jgi:NADPH-dependent 2,4-dienoyl-CoA reductase/sulfur reductase-like enzyme/nitrite reductase/ring-hydroxylating ferredoxin subunit